MLTHYQKMPISSLYFSLNHHQIQKEPPLLLRKKNWGYEHGSSGYLPIMHKTQSSNTSLVKKEKKNCIGYGSTSLRSQHWGGRNRSVVSARPLNYIRRPCLKNTNRTGGVTQVVEHVPSKCEFKPYYCQKAKQKTQHTKQQKNTAYHTFRIC
jgi:hypothetical protein